MFVKQLIISLVVIFATLFPLPKPGGLITVTLITEIQTSA